MNFFIGVDSLQYLLFSVLLCVPLVPVAILLPKTGTPEYTENTERKVGLHLNSTPRHLENVYRLDPIFDCQRLAGVDGY